MWLKSVEMHRIQATTHKRWHMQHLQPHAATEGHAHPHRRLYRTNLLLNALGMIGFVQLCIMPNIHILVFYIHGQRLLITVNMILFLCVAILANLVRGIMLTCCIKKRSHIVMASTTFGRKLSILIRLDHHISLSFMSTVYMYGSGNIYHWRLNDIQTP